MRILKFQNGIDFSLVILILVCKVEFQCASWASRADPCILVGSDFQLGFWDCSVDPGIQMWLLGCQCILGYQCESCDSSVNTEIPVWN